MLKKHSACFSGSALVHNKFSLPLRLILPSSKIPSTIMKATPPQCWLSLVYVRNKSANIWMPPTHILHQTVKSRWHLSMALDHLFALVHHNPCMVSILVWESSRHQQASNNLEYHFLNASLNSLPDSCRLQLLSTVIIWHKLVKFSNKIFNVSSLDLKQRIWVFQYWLLIQVCIFCGACDGWRRRGHFFKGRSTYTTHPTVQQVFHILGHWGVGGHEMVDSIIDNIFDWHLLLLLLY